MFRLISAVSGSVLWIAVVLVVSLQGWWRVPLAPGGDARAFLSALEQSVQESFRGNLIATLVEAGVPVGNVVVGPNGAEPGMKSVFKSPRSANG